MQVKIAKTAGFCFGVRRATSSVEEFLSDSSVKAIYTLGSLIHNRLYIEELESKGVHAISLSDVPSIAKQSDTIGLTYLIIRTHGIPKEDEEFLNEQAKSHPNLVIHDLTCPFVKKIHKIAEKETNPESTFLLLGSKTHAESIGILSYAKGKKIVFSSLEELKEHLNELTQDAKIIFVAQTTQSVIEWEKTENFIKKLYTNTKIFDTICNVTESRQSEVKELARNSDCVLVIGGKESSNTKKLYETSLSINPNTFWMESADEIESLSGYTQISITAGASTPDSLITEVYKKMSTENNFEALLNESLKSIYTGEIVSGVVINVDDKQVLLDLGVKQTGSIAAEKFTSDPSVKLSSLVKVGDEVKARVIQVSDRDGFVTLDKISVDKDKAWIDFAENAKDSFLEGKVTKVVKGGLTVDLGGKSAFVPAGQSGVPMNGDLNALVGTTTKVKILEVDESRKRIVASIKAYKNVLRAEEKAAKQAAKQAAFDKLEVGQKIHTKIKNLTPYGAFVDLGGVDGMIHKSELSWKEIKNPAQVVSVGEEVDVIVKELDAENLKVSLGYKTPEMDKFSIYAANHKPGEIVSAKIVSIVPFGAFAEVAEDVDGLIHNSRISLDPVEDASKLLTVGQTVDVKIVAIDREKRQIALSIRAILEQQRREEEAAQRQAEKEARDAERKAAREEYEKERAEIAPYLAGSIEA